jgi:hypothetical protein
MQILKKWLSQLKNFFNKHLKKYYLAFFAGESHQVVKITVTYSPLVPNTLLTSCSNDFFSPVL